MEPNKEQKDVINILDRNISVIASAGTGKTETLARRVANIIDSDMARPEEILCISFTNKASKEMKNRIEEIVGPKSRGVTVQTFHSWCFNIIKLQAKRQTDIFTDFIVYDEEDCKSIVGQARESIPEFQNRIFTNPMLQRFINLIKEEKAVFITNNKDHVTWEDLIRNIFINKRNVIDDIASSNKKANSKEDKILIKTTIRSYGHELLERYNEILLSNRGVDFNDLILNTLVIVKDENISQSIASTYKYINIDEVQDTSLVEYFIIKQIFADSKTLLCGDTFQTIYQWRGSAPEKILKDYVSNYNPKQIVFKTNYRANQNLVNLSTHYLKNAFPSKCQTLNLNDLEIASSKKGHKIVVKENYDIDNEAAYIYNEIKNSPSLGSIAILSRSNPYNKELSKSLGRLQSPEDKFKFVLVDDFNFFRRKEIKDVTALMKLLINKNDSISFKRVLSNFSLGIGKLTLDKIESDEYKKLGIRLTDYIDINTRRTGDPFGNLINALDQGNLIVFDVETTGVDTSQDEIIQIAAMRIDSAGNEIDRFERLLKNTKSVGSSYNVHNFTDEELARDGFDKVQALEDFVDYANGSVLVGHNVNFDINILKSELSRNNLCGLNFIDYYDTLDIYRRFYPNLHNHKLEFLSNEFQTKVKPTHDAMDDILATSELLIGAVTKNILPTSLERIEKIQKHLVAFEDISNKLDILYNQSLNMRPADLVQAIVINFKMKDIYTEDKIENLRNFYFLLKEIDTKDKNNHDALIEALKITSLSSGEVELLMLKGRNKTNIPIITVHQAKGLEFDTVFLAGIYQNEFPSYRAVMSKDLEEEKRTFYVAITRAKKKLYITYTNLGRFGRPNNRSKFIDFLPDQFLEIG